MSVKARWLVSASFLLAGLLLMLGAVFGFNAANTALSALAGFGGLVGLAQQLLPSSTRQHPSVTERLPTAPSSLPHQRQRRLPWLVLTAGTGLILLIGIALAILRPEDGTNDGGRLYIELDTYRPDYVDLTAEEDIDWVHWGYSPSDMDNLEQFGGGYVRDECKYNAHCVNRKKNVNQISDFTPIGNVSPYRLYYRDSVPQFRWSDGMPIETVSGVKSFVYMGLANNGFRITVPAGRESREFNLYVNAHVSKLACSADLSDNSASPVKDFALSSFGEPTGDRYGKFSFKYRAGSYDQRLTVTIIVQEDLGGANVALYAATLR